MLWREFRATFTLPKGVDEEEMKQYALKKMVNAFPIIQEEVVWELCQGGQDTAVEKIPSYDLIGK